MENKKKHKYKNFTESEKLEIIDYFEKNKNNSIPAIAEVFETSYHCINKIINKYLKDKMIEM